ncbi:MAG: 30S ribosomal protein S9 [bacterium]
MAKKAAKEYYWGTGRRKTSVARVRLIAGDGKIEVNGQPLDKYFGRKTLQAMVRQPLEATATQGKIDVFVKVEGGGISGQAGAIRHGISRALVKMDEHMRPPLKRAGFLTRDPRMVERKKYGQPGARKRFQFSKR